VGGRLLEISHHGLESMQEIIGGVDISINCVTNYGYVEQNKSQIISSNLIFPLELFELSMALNAKKFINLDSFVNKKGNSYPKLYDYALSKQSLILWLQEFSKAIPTVTFRIEHMYGPKDNPNKFIPWLIQKIVKERVSELSLSYGYQKRDFIHVDDVADALVYYLKMDGEKERKPHTPNADYQEYELGTTVPHTIKTLVEKVRDLADSKTNLRFGNLQESKVEIASSFSDGVFQKQFNWASKVSLDEGLRKLVSE
jgi:CDP-paratose synthetase